MKEEKKPRLLVDVEDQLPTEAASKSLRARAYSRRQLLICRLQPHLLRASQTFFCCASLLLLHRPDTPATSAGRFGVATMPNRSQLGAAPQTCRWPGEKGQHRASFGLFGPTRHGSRVSARFRTPEYTPLKKRLESASSGKSPM